MVCENRCHNPGNLNGTFDISRDNGFLEIKNKKRKRNKFDSLATVIIGLTVLVMGFIEPDNLNAACIKLIIAFCVLYYIPDLFFPRVSD